MVTRIVKHSDSISWYTLSKINILNLFSLGPGYVNEITKDIDNPFWKDILKNWHDFCNLVEIETVQNVLDSPVWYNKNLINGYNFCIWDWFKRGIRQVSDLSMSKEIFVLLKPGKLDSG